MLHARTESIFLRILKPSLLSLIRKYGYLFLNQRTFQNLVFNEDNSNLLVSSEFMLKSKEIPKRSGRLDSVVSVAGLGGIEKCGSS